MVPTRFMAPAEPSEQLTRLSHFLTREDPLADAVIDALVDLPREAQEASIARMLSPRPGSLPAPLQTLHDWLRVVPFWFDEARANTGGEVLVRNGLLAGFVLGFKSLVLGYCSPAGNKPLAFSGRLTADVNRRLAETARFVEAVSLAGGTHFGSPGFTAAVRVRLIHARVRHALRRAPVWKAEAWGAPINQYDMAATVLLFSSMLIAGLRDLGVTVSNDDEAANLHLWRAVGRLMGVDEELLATSPGEAHALWSAIEATEGEPDQHSRQLTHALILEGADRGTAPPAAIDFGYAMCRHLVGNRRADQLALPRSGWDVAPALMKRVVRGVDSMARYVPGARDGALLLGAKYWRRTVELTFGNREVTFELPTRPISS